MTVMWFFGSFGLRRLPLVLFSLVPDGFVVGRVGTSPKGTPRLPVPENCAVILPVAAIESLPHLLQTTCQL